MWAHVVEAIVGMDRYLSARFAAPWPRDESTIRDYMIRERLGIPYVREDVQ